jgi:hypothetical protein
MTAWWDGATDGGVAVEVFRPQTALAQNARLVSEAKANNDSAEGTVKCAGEDARKRGPLSTV